MKDFFIRRSNVSVPRGTSKERVSQQKVITLELHYIEINTLSNSKTVSRNLKEVGHLLAKT